MTRQKRIIVGLCMGALIYFNTASLLLVCGVRLPRWEPRSQWTAGPLPNHWLSERIFRMFDLFDRWSWQNWGFGAYGVKERLETPPKAPTDDMIDLDIYDYFPHQRGEQNRRIYLLSSRNNPARLKVEYKRMADNIQRIHNARHPDDPVAQVLIYQYAWRKGKEGYWQYFSERTADLQGHN